MTLLRTFPIALTVLAFTTAARAQSTAYCFGDGAGTPCPCGNSGVTGNGCASSVNPNGANLATSGTPSVSNDTYVLLGTGMPNGPCLYFQGSAQLGGGNGIVFGDGLRCVGGTIVRLGIKTNVGGASQYPDVGDTPIATKAPPSPPQTCYNQVWYRDSAAGFCTAAVFNLTNGRSATWIP